MCGWRVQLLNIFKYLYALELGKELDIDGKDAAFSRKSKTVLWKFERFEIQEDNQ